MVGVIDCPHVLRPHLPLTIALMFSSLRCCRCSWDCGTSSSSLMPPTKSSGLEAQSATMEVYIAHQHRLRCRKLWGLHVANVRMHLQSCKTLGAHSSSSSTSMCFHFLASLTLVAALSRRERRSPDCCVFSLGTASAFSSSSLSGQYSASLILLYSFPHELWARPLLRNARCHSHENRCRSRR